MQGGDEVEGQSSSIRAIDSTSVHKITSAQVVVDLPTAVKELLENSLDAGATTVEVRFKEYGLEGFEVVDNGSGISEANLATVALNHHTSKLGAFEDLGNLTTFGFRGEALSSLCALSKFKLLTSTAETEPKGWAVEFDKLGNVTSKKICARPRGTTISISGLFHTLPVRQKQFAKDYKKQFAQAQTLLQAYGLISTNLDLRVSNQPAKGSKVFQCQTRANSSIRQNFASIFTAKASDSVIDFEVNLLVSPDKVALKSLVVPPDESSGPEAIGTPVKVEGLVSKPVHGQGRASADRQFFYINGRPFAPSKVAKCMNDVYRQFNPNQYPVVLANFLLSPDAYDLNIDPNKRTVFLHSEHNLVEALRIQMEIAFQPHRSTFALSQISSFPSSFLSNLQSEGPSTKSLKRKVPIVLPSPDPAPQMEAEQDASTPAKKGRVEALDVSVVVPLKETNESLPLFLPDSELPLAPSRRDDVSQTPWLSAASSTAPKTPDKDLPEPWLPSALRDGSASSRNRTPVQTTLNTSGASWNLHKAGTSTSKGKTSARKSGTRKAVNSTQRLKACLQQFTRARGADVDVLAPGEMDQSEEEADQEEESSPSEKGVGDHEMEEAEVEPGRCSPSASERSSTRAEDLESNKSDPAHVENSSNSSSREPSVVSGSVQAGPSEWRDEIDSGPIAGEVVVALDMDALEKHWARRVVPTDAPVAAADDIDELMAAGLSEPDTQAMAALSRTVHQSDFATMKVIGQFNLGFIIASLGSEDVLIVDQHASDEKYNFERLQRDTKLSGQRLLTPRVLDLPAAEELTAMEHLDLLELNGFGISVDEEAPVGQRVKLVAQPESRDTVWGPADLEELIHLIRNADLGAKSSKSEPGAPPLRPSKTRKMFASRACRSSVMIGDSLTVGQMRTILDRMGTMKEPWACPHGRPTMRWLARCEGEAEMNRRENVKELLEEHFL